MSSCSSAMRASRERMLRFSKQDSCKRRLLPCMSCALVVTHRGRDKILTLLVEQLQFDVSFDLISGSTGPSDIFEE